MNSNKSKNPEHVLEIKTDIIELYKVLKAEGLVSSGGEAKLVIADGQVSVNGKVETRKRKKSVMVTLLSLLAIK
jgi:ribosome-associated protein